MTATLEDDNVGLAAIEGAAVRSWPALEAVEIDGWLVRLSSGGSVRANTVSALAYRGRDVDQSIAEVAAFYRGRGAVARFTVTDVSVPGDLDHRLAQAGWERGGDHLTMAKWVEPVADRVLPAPGLSVVRLDTRSDEWMSVYLSGLSESRRAVAPQLIGGVPRPRSFFACLRSGTVIASGLSVVDGTLASVQCMATTISARRTGAARAILKAIERGAAESGVRRIYLQTEVDNFGAVALYRGAGFAVVGHYHVRTLAG